jgi:hypothetical protein
MVYLKLFHGRSPKDEDLQDWGSEGPIFGPFPYFHTTYATEIKFGEYNILNIDDDMVYYDGVWYGDWSVYSNPELYATTDFDEEKAKLPKRNHE